jgi:hypothetical protein
MPGYKLHGMMMMYFAGFKEHYSLFAASGTSFAALKDELNGSGKYSSSYQSVLRTEPGCIASMGEVLYRFLKIGI